jgi:hypothetical protein
VVLKATFANVDVASSSHDLPNHPWRRPTSLGFAVAHPISAGLWQYPNCPLVMVGAPAQADSTYLTEPSQLHHGGLVDGWHTGDEAAGLRGG